jgi:hypothetical protein
MQRYDVLTMFPIKHGLWELLVLSQSLDTFRTWTTNCGFDIEEYGLPRRGLFVRASIIRHQARCTQDTNPFLEEAALFYESLLKSYSYLNVLIDIAGAIFSIPTSVCMGFYLEVVGTLSPNRKRKLGWSHEEGKCQYGKSSRGWELFSVNDCSSIDRRGAWQHCASLVIVVEILATPSIQLTP